MNTKHKEVGLQSNLKLVVSKIYGQISGSANDVVSKALAVINTVAGADSKIGFRDKITGVGTLLGNVLVLDLNIPLMNKYVDSADESAFNNKVARALINEFGTANVGFLSSNPVTTKTVTVTVETDSETSETAIANALRGVANSVTIR